jgi:hypothetical protein
VNDSMLADFHPLRIQDNCKATLLLATEREFSFY